MSTSNLKERARSWARSLTLVVCLSPASACLAQAPAPPSASASVELKRALTLPPPQRQALLKRHLSPLEYYVTQEQGTERPFRNRYWDNKKEGIYVDVISGAPLFSSAHKYRSGTGWPSFDRPIEPRAVQERRDSTLGVVRVEVISSSSQGHLGHVFEDGPSTTGRRYCMNSAALRFIPVEEMSARGYADWLTRAGLRPSEDTRPPKVPTPSKPAAP